MKPQQEQPEQLPRLLIIETSGHAYAPLLELKGVLQTIGYESVYATPTVDRGEGFRLPSDRGRRLLYLLYKRLTGAYNAFERVLLMPGSSALARILPGRLLLKLGEEEEPGGLLRGFALAEARKSYYPRDEEEDPSPKRSKIHIVVTGVDEEQAEGVSRLLERVADFGDQFVAAGIQFLLLGPIPKELSTLLESRSIPGELFTLRAGLSPDTYYTTVRDADALLAVGESTTFWGAALNKPVITSTAGRLTPELRSLSVYFTGIHIEEIAEKVTAGQLDRESLSYVRVSPHMFAQAAVASFREERNRIEKSLALTDR